MPQLYNYQATVIKVVDGDTVDFTVDCGFHISVDIATRLLGINAPELNTQEGKDARTYLQGLLPVGKQVTIETYKYPGDKYGRWLAVIMDGTTDINDLMVSSGHAVPYTI